MYAYIKEEKVKTWTEIFVIKAFQVEDFDVLVHFNRQMEVQKTNKVVIKMSLEYLKLL